MAHALILQPPFLRKFNGIPRKTGHGFSALIPRKWHCSTKGRFLRNPNGLPQKTHMLAKSVLRKQHLENIAYVRGTQVFSEEVHWDSSDLALIFASSSSEGSQTSDSSDT